jgi:hypothetical protein
MSYKVIAGASVGVFVPIIIEYAAKGADVNPSFPIKISGLSGVVMGAVPIGLALAKVGPFRMMSESSKMAVLAFGAASLATGISILILEQLRNSAGYAFTTDVQPWMNSRPGGLPPPARNGLAQQYTAPVGSVIKEI